LTLLNFSDRVTEQALVATADLKLASERKAEVKKMSVFRLVTKLEQAGVRPDQLELMDRNALLEVWAEIVLVGGDKVTASATKPTTATSSLSEVERQRLQFNIDKFKWEQEEAKRKYQELREFRRQEQVEAKRRNEEEVALRKAELKTRDEEQELRRLEVIRLRDRDAKETEEQNTAASKIKIFGDAFRNTAFKMSNEPIDLIPFFDNVERLFTELAISNELRVPLLRPYLNDKAKSLLMRLDATRASDYTAVAEFFLLHEFALTPTLYLERFYTISRQNDETCVLYCSRLKGLIDYYCKSRAVTDFNSVFSLLVSGHIKTTLSDDCIKDILSIEAATENGWLPHNPLSEKIDVYHANHWNDKPRTGSIGKTAEFSNNYRLKTTRGQDKSQAPSLSHKTDYVKKEKTCFRCKSTSHLIANCPVKSPGDNNRPSYTNKSAKVNRCAVTDYYENDTSAPRGDANNHESAVPYVE